MALVATLLREEKKTSPVLFFSPACFALALKLLQQGIIKDYYIEKDKLILIVLQIVELVEMIVTKTLSCKEIYLVLKAF